MTARSPGVGRAGGRYTRSAGRERANMLGGPPVRHPDCARSSVVVLWPAESVHEVIKRRQRKEKKNDATRPTASSRSR